MPTNRSQSSLTAEPSVEQTTGDRRVGHASPHGESPAQSSFAANDPRLDSPQAAEAGRELPSFTPGPWTVVLGSRRGTFFVVQAATHEASAADTDQCDGYTVSNANARLIAAAPDLFAALNKIIECLDLAERNDDLPLPLVGYGHQFIDDAKAALAKVRS